MQLSWMLALLITVASRANGIPKGTSERSDLTDIEGGLPRVVIFTKEGEALPYIKLVSDGQSSRRQNRALMDYVPRAGQQAMSAMSGALPSLPPVDFAGALPSLVSSLDFSGAPSLDFPRALPSLPSLDCKTSGHWSLTCCVHFHLPMLSKGCFELRIDETLQISFIPSVNDVEFRAVAWKLGKLSVPIGNTFTKASVYVYYLDVNTDKKEVDICYMVSWSPIINIDNGCYHVTREEGFSAYVREPPSDNPGLATVRWVDGKPKLEFWRPKSVKEFASLVIGSPFNIISGGKGVTKRTQ